MRTPDESKQSTTVPGSQGDWITKRVAQALVTCPATDAVVSAVELQLRGTIRERPLNAAELAKISKLLIAVVNDSRPKETTE